MHPPGGVDRREQVGQPLAAAGGGRSVPLHKPSDAPAAVRAVLMPIARQITDATASTPARISILPRVMAPTYEPAGGAGYTVSSPGDMTLPVDTSHGEFGDHCSKLSRAARPGPA